MLSVAICDDELRHQQIVLGYCQQLMEREFEDELVAQLFSTPDALLAAVEKGRRFDLLLCDIYMPGILGVDAIQEMRDRNDTTRVVFITSSVDHMADAVALHASGYLTKPCSQEAFDAAVAPLFRRILQERSECVELKTQDGSSLIRFSDIAYITTEGHDQVIWLDNGLQKTTRMSSRALFELLAHDSRFFKAGSSYIINLDAVRSIVDAEVEFLDNLGSIRIPARMNKKISDAFMERAFEVSF